MRTCRGSFATSIPRTRIDPWVGSRSVEIMRIVVVFPAPFGPRRPKISPCWTVRSMPSTARKVVRRSGSRRARCQSVRRPFWNSLTRPCASTAAVEVIRAEELVKVDAEFRQMSADQAARAELHLADARDRERDRDVDLLFAALG